MSLFCLSIGSIRRSIEKNKMEELNPYAAPIARVSDVDEVGKQQMAEPQTRLWAYLMDSLLYVLVGLICSALGLMFWELPVSEQLTEDATLAEVFGGIGYMILIVAAGVAALFIYNCVLLYRNGQTIGKRIFNIKIVRPDGSRASFPRIFFLRLLLQGILQSIPFGVGALYWLIDSLYLLRDDRRCIHDHIADTVVIKA